MIFRFFWVSDSFIDLCSLPHLKLAFSRNSAGNNLRSVVFVNNDLQRYLLKIEQFSY